MRVQVGRWVIAFLLAGCTEPNPFAEMDSDDASTTNVTTMGTLPTSTSTPGTPMNPTSTTESTSTMSETTDVATTMTSMTTNDPSSSTGDPPVCPSGHACVEEAPAGWTGPVSVARTMAGRPMCEGDFPDVSLTAFADLVAPPATCECACDEPSGLACAFPTLQYFSVSTTCSGSPNSSWVIDSSCELVSGAPAEHWRVPSPAVTEGQCSPQVVTDTVMPAEWGATLTACGGTFDATGCEQGALCVRMPAEPFASEVCIWREGDVDCPAGSYVDRSVYYTDFSDTRDCSACGCGAAQGQCVGRVRAFQDQTCTTPINTFTANGMCFQGYNTIGVGSARWEVTPADITASCAPTGGDSVGLAAPTEPRTLCCASL